MGGKFLKKLWCCVCGRVQRSHCVLSTEFIMWICHRKGFLRRGVLGIGLQVVFLGNLCYLYSNATKISATERNRSSIQSSYKPGTFKRAHTRCKTCSFIHDVQKYRNPRNPFTDQFTCTSANFICYLTCTYSQKLCIGETGIWSWTVENILVMLRDITRVIFRILFA